MYHNFFDQKGVNKMAQRKFIIDGGFKTDDASELLANLTMGGSILPNVDSDGTTGFDLGSTTAKWKDLYLSQGSLFINNQKVLQDDSGTIVVSADNDQGMTVKTTGTGVLSLSSDTTVNMNGTLQMAAGKKITDANGTAVALGDKLDMDSNLIINVGTAVANTDAANKAYVDGAIADLVNGAPGTMDTLNELANALGDDANFSTTVTNSIAANAGDIVTANTNIASNLAAINVNSADIVTANTAIGTKANTTYVDAQNVAQTTALETYADTAEADAISTAAGDATTKANAAQAAAEATASADATTKADAAQAAAESTAAAANTALETSINAAWAAADATQTSSINSAWAAADSAQTTSLQAYADTAEADAISTASADATSKADAALVSAKSYTDSEITSLIGGAPGTLDTLNELAAALSDDANYAASVTSAIAAAQTAAQNYADANDNNTTYSAGNGLSLSGTQFLMSGSYSGSFTATGDITAYSDDSLKTNVQVIDGALGKVEAIRGVTFERIEDGSVSTGVIAQELKAVLPEAVHTDAEGVHSVAYGNITGLLIEAVKELSAQVEELKAK
jgi:hypothetical protein